VKRTFKIDSHLFVSFLFGFEKATTFFGIPKLADPPNTRKTVLWLKHPKISQLKPKCGRATPSSENLWKDPKVFHSAAFQFQTRAIEAL
jgi:hypothetical protein